MFTELIVEYVDPKWEIYSYDDADTIWCQVIETPIPEWIRQQLPHDWDGYSPIEISVPIDEATKNGKYLLLARNSATARMTKAMAEYELYGGCLDDEGSPVEVDGPGSPLADLI